MGVPTLVWINSSGALSLCVFIQYQRWYTVAFCLLKCWLENERARAGKWGPDAHAPNPPFKPCASRSCWCGGVGDDDGDGGDVDDDDGCCGSCG